VAGLDQGYGMVELLDRGGAELWRGGAQRGCALGFVRRQRDGMEAAEGRMVLFVGRRGDLGVRARGWKAGAIVAGDLGFGCARKTMLQLGPGGQRVKRARRGALGSG
jgi:hypothetical protein